MAAKRIYIRHGSKWPPHYQVVVDQVVYDLYPVDILILKYRAGTMYFKQSH
jgi:hypothetical protein